MKILFASSSSGSRGGGETFLVYLGEALAWRGHEVVLWASSHPRMDEVATRFGAFGAVHRADYTNTYDRPRRSLGALMDGRTAARAAREWEALKPDIDPREQAEPRGWAGPAAGDGHDRAPERMHDPYYAERGIPGGEGGVAAGLGVAARAAGVSGGRWWRCRSRGRRTWRRFLGRTGAGSRRSRMGCRFRRPMPASERARRRAELGLAPDDLAILAVGRMTAQKRPLLFLEIAGRILARVPEAKFSGSATGRWRRSGRRGRRRWGSRRERNGWAGGRMWRRCWGARTCCSTRRSMKGCRWRSSRRWRRGCRARSRRRCTGRCRSWTRATRSACG